MRFRLPEITYPLRIDTIGKVLATGHELYVSCHAVDCHNRSRVNMVRLGYRLGFDHSSLQADISPYFHCSRCGSKDMGFTLLPPSEFCRIDGRSAPVNPYQRPKGG